MLTNAYQAEYGRSSGAQVSVVTKSGGRDYRGSAYWYRRQESFNANTWINNRNRGRALATDPDSRVGLKPINRQSDIGFTVGGPCRSAATTRTSNRLFFFFALEHQQRFTPPADPRRVRVPTELERRGDFSQKRRQQQPALHLIRDYQTGLPCTATDTRGCFQDGGVLGRIPANRLYAPGLAILNIYPLPNAPAAPTTTTRRRSPADRSARGHRPRRLAGERRVARLRPLLQQHEQRRRGHRPLRPFASAPTCR